MPGITPNWTAVYGCTSDVLWISPILVLSVYLSLNPWEAPSWQVIAIDEDVKQVIISWLKMLDNTVFTLEYNAWYHCGANAEMVVVTTWRSDVYHLLHMCHALIKVTITFWQVFVTLFCESSLYIHCSLNRWFPKYWVFWMVGFLCCCLIIFTMKYLF